MEGGRIVRNLYSRQKMEAMIVKALVNLCLTKLTGGVSKYSTPINTCKYIYNMALVDQKYRNF